MKPTKKQYVSELNANWDTLQSNTKQIFISSLLGHRMSFAMIAKAIGRTIDEVKEAYSYVEATAEAPSFSQNVPDNCGNSDGYTGQIPPSCAGGDGCKVCWAIYNNVHGTTLPPDPKVAEVAPIKTMYTTMTFDDILARYREWIGWKGTPSKPPASTPDGEYLDGVIVSDIHAPFHDEQAFANFLVQTKGLKLCILGGDGPDFHNYSKYIKYGQHFNIVDEHKAFMAVLAMLSENFEEVIMIPGNHDDRTRKKYASLLPPDLYQALLDIHGPKTFDFAELMAEQFENIIIPTMPTHGFAEYRFIYQFYDIIVGHPSLFSKIPNKSVGGFIDWLMKKAMPMGLVKPFSAAVMGHTHMAGKTWNDYAIIGIENGCLCMTPDYDSGDKLAGAPRPLTLGYTRFRTNLLTGTTHPNDINFVQL